MSIASQVHAAIYGKSDKANAPENANAEFQAGYLQATNGTYGHDGLDAIKQEWERRGCPQRPEAGFQEWKRGYWAGRLQRAELKFQERINARL